MARQPICILLLAGTKRSGKDTVADYLVDTFQFKKLSFAAPLKAVCKDIFDLTAGQLDGDNKDSVDSRYNKTPRQIVQYFGTDLMQFELMKFMPEMGRLVWVQKLMRDIGHSNVVISDMRFKHEYDAVYAMYPEATKMIRVHNEAATAAGKDDLHCSETDWQQVIPDGHLYNNTTKEALYQQVNGLIS